MDKQKKRETFLLEIMNKIKVYSSEGETYQPVKLLKYLKLIRSQQQQSSSSTSGGGYVEKKLRDIGGIHSLLLFFNRNIIETESPSNTTLSSLSPPSKKTKTTTNHKNKITNNSASTKKDSQNRSNKEKQQQLQQHIDIEVCTNGLSILGNAFAVDSRSRRDADKVQFIQTLKYFLESSTFSSNPDILARVLKCLANLATDDKLRSSILQLGIGITVINHLDNVYNNLINTIGGGGGSSIKDLVVLHHHHHHHHYPSPEESSDIVKIEEIIVEKNEENIVCQAARAIRLFSKDFEFQQHLVRFGAVLSIGRFLKFFHNQTLFSDILKALAVLTTTSTLKKLSRETFEKFETLTDEDSPERLIMLRMIEIVKSYHSVKSLVEPALICLTQLASNVKIANDLVSSNIFEACLTAIEKTDDIPRLDKILRLLVVLTQETPATTDRFSHHLRLSCCMKIGQTLKILKIPELKNYHHWILKLYENLSEDKLKDLVNRGIINILDDYLRSKLGDYSFEGLSKKLSTRDDDKCFVHTNQDATCPFSPKFRCSSPSYQEVQNSDNHKSSRVLDDSELPAVLNTLQLNSNVLSSPCTSPYESPNDETGERYSCFSPTYSPVNSPPRKLSFSPPHSSGQNSPSYSDDDEGSFSYSTNGGTLSPSLSPQITARNNDEDSIITTATILTTVTQHNCEYSEDELDDDDEEENQNEIEEKPVLHKNLFHLESKTRVRKSSDISGDVEEMEEGEEAEDERNEEQPPRKKVKFQLTREKTTNHDDDDHDDTLKLDKATLEEEEGEEDSETEEELTKEQFHSLNISPTSKQQHHHHQQPPTLDQIRTRYNKIVSILGILKRIAHSTSIPIPISLTKYLPFLLEIIWSTRMAVENSQTELKTWEQCTEFLPLARLCFQRAQSIVFRICSDINTFPSLVEDNVIPLMYRILLYNLRDGRPDHTNEVKTKIRDFLKEYSNKLMASLVGIVNGENHTSGWREGYFLRKCCIGPKNHFFIKNNSNHDSSNSISSHLNDNFNMNIVLSIPLLYHTNTKIFRDFEEKTHKWAKIFELLTNVDELSFAQFQNCILALTCIGQAKGLKWLDAQNASKRKLLYLPSPSASSSTTNSINSCPTNILTNQKTHDKEMEIDMIPNYPLQQQQPQEQQQLEDNVIFELDDGSTMTLQKEELVEASPYFIAMFTGHFREAKNNRVHLPNTSRAALIALARQIHEENEENRNKNQTTTNRNEPIIETTTVCDRIMHSYDLSTLFELLSLSDQFLLDNIYERTLNTLISFYICPHSVPLIYEESLKFQGFHRSSVDNQVSSSFSSGTRNINISKLVLKYLLVGEDICFTLRSGSFWKIFDSTVPSLVVQSLQEILGTK